MWRLKPEMRTLYERKYYCRLKHFQAKRSKNSSKEKRKVKSEKLRTLKPQLCCMKPETAEGMKLETLSLESAALLPETCFRTLSARTEGSNRRRLET